MLPTTAHLPFADPTKVPGQLDHAEVSLKNKQCRLQCRSALIPQIDLEKYRFRAVIDWIEFRVHLGRGTQLQHLQDFLRPFLGRKPFIEREDKSAGDVFSICTIKIQEPAGLAHVTVIHQALIAKYGELAPSCVTGIEISLDAYAKNETAALRSLMVGVMQRTIWTNRDIWTNSNSRPRSIIGMKKVDVFKLLPRPDDIYDHMTKPTQELCKEPFADGTMYLGAEDDDVMIRVMDKVKDGQHPDGTFIALTDQTSRARIEVTLKVAELLRIGLTDIASLRQFKLTEVQGRYFQFRLPTFAIRQNPKRTIDVISNNEEARRADAYLRSGNLAVMLRDEARLARWKTLKRRITNLTRASGGVSVIKKTSRLSTNTFVAYRALDRKVAVAIRHLSAREERAWRKVTAKVG